MITREVIPTTVLTVLAAPICFMLVSKVAIRFADEQQ